MVEREAFRLRLAKLEELLRHLRRLAATEREEFLADPGLQAQAERWLQLAGEVTIDLAQHVIADRGWRTPSTYREAFRILRDEGLLEPELARNMEGWAGLRNVLVHIYLEVDAEQIYLTLTEELGQLEEFTEALRRIR